MVLKVQKELLGKIQNFDTHTPEIIDQGVVHMECISMHNSWNQAHEIWGGKEENKDNRITQEVQKPYLYVYGLEKPLMYIIILSEEGRKEKWLLAKADLS